MASGRYSDDSRSRSRSDSRDSRSRSRSRSRSNSRSGSRSRGNDNDGDLDRHGNQRRSPRRQREFREQREAREKEMGASSRDMDRNFRYDRYNDKAHSKNDKPCKIIGCFGMSFRTDERELKYRFGKYGDIDQVVLVWNNKLNRSKGYAFITYHDIESAKEAVEKMNGKEIDGQNVRVDFSFTRTGKYGDNDRGSFHYKNNNYNDNYRYADKRRRSRSRSPRRRRSRSNDRSRRRRSRSDSYDDSRRRRR